jgi:hypothetical protein
MTHILFVGQQPETVDFSDPAGITTLMAHCPGIQEVVLFESPKLTIRSHFQCPPR